MPIEQAAPGLDRIVSLEQEVEWLGSGYGGSAVAEGISGPSKCSQMARSL